MQERSAHEPARYCLFDTDHGPCGVAWSEVGLRRLQLPERDRSATAKRLRATAAGAHPDTPPTRVAKVIDRIRDYFAGRRVEFSSVPLDLVGVSPFHRRIYAATCAVGWGDTASYGELARRVGAPGAARAVGQAMAHNPVPIIIPCHRILASGNKVGGFSAFGGAIAKQRLLALEGVRLDDDAPLLPGLFVAPS